MIIEAQPDMEVSGEAEDGRAALELARRDRPDVVLMDIRMPGVDGIEATRRMLDVPGRAPRVLILTTFDLDEYVYEAMHAGASGFLLKSARPQQLVSAVRGAVEGETLLAPEITRRLVETFVRRPKPGVQRPPELEALTNRELEVLRHIACGHLDTGARAEARLSGPRPGAPPLAPRRSTRLRGRRDVGPGRLTLARWGAVWPYPVLASRVTTAWMRSDTPATARPISVATSSPTT